MANLTKIRIKTFDFPNYFSDCFWKKCPNALKICQMIANSYSSKMAVTKFSNSQDKFTKHELKLIYKISNYEF